MRIGILKCDSRDKPVPSSFGRQEDRAISLLRAADPECETFVFDVADGDYPFTPDDCDAYVCLGSEASVNDRTPWIERLAVFTHDLYHYGIPMVGICFGHQMMARVLGGKVRKCGPGKSGHGLLPFRVACEESWMQPDIRFGHLAHYHGEQVAVLPKSATVLGSSPHCPNALVRFGRHFLGIQAHPEMCVGFVRELIEARAERMSPEAVNAALVTLDSPEDGAVLGSWMVHFLEGARHPFPRVRPSLWG